eukprot:15433952-Alexandrium_andersonii.AAC.1
MRVFPIQRRILAVPLRECPEVGILHFLDKSSQDTDFHGLTIRQLVNVVQQLQQFQASLLPGQESVGIVDIARGPMKKFCSE